MDEQSPSEESTARSPSDSSTKSLADVSPRIATNWRYAWVRGISKLPNEAAGELLDMDIRLSALPPGAFKDVLGQWLDYVGGGLVSGTLQPPKGGEDYNHPLRMLRHHISFAQFKYRNLRLAHSLA
jgi:hypothetical protein